MTEQESFNVGAILTLSTGSYSDYDVTMVARVLKPITTAQVVADYDAATREQRAAYHAYCRVVVATSYREKYEGERIPQPIAFFPWLVLEGYVEEIPFEDWNIDQ